MQLSEILSGPSAGAQPRPDSRASSLALIAIALIVAFGSFCRIAQYAARASYWHDEALVVLNVMHKSPRQLMGKLDYAQAAPPLFLIGERELYLHFGGSEFSLRVISLACGLLGLFLFAWLCWRVLPSPMAPWIVALFALSDKLIWHSAEVKPYSGDVCVAVLLLFIAIGRSQPAVESSSSSARQNGNPLLRFAMLCLTAAAAIWFSFPAVFVFGGLSLALLPSLSKRGASARLAWIIGNAIVVGSFALLYLLCIRRQHVDYLSTYWAKDFPDLAHPLSVPAWLAEEIYALADFSHRSFGFLILLLTLVGIIQWGRTRQRRFLAVCLWPIVLAIVAAFLKQYPFNGDRTTLYLQPGLLLLAGAGCMMLARALPVPLARWWFVPVLIILARGTWEAAYALAVPRTRSNIRSVVDYVRAHRQPGEGLYLIGESAEHYDSTLCLELLCYWPDPPGPWHAGLPADLSEIPEHRFWLVAATLPKKGKQTLDAMDKKLAPIASERQRHLASRGAGAAALFEHR